MSSTLDVLFEVRRTGSTLMTGSIPMDARQYVSNTDIMVSETKKIPSASHIQLDSNNFDGFIFVENLDDVAEVTLGLNNAGSLLPVCVIPPNGFVVLNKANPSNLYVQSTVNNSLIQMVSYEL